LILVLTLWSNTGQKQNLKFIIYSAIEMWALKKIYIYIYTHTHTYIHSVIHIILALRFL
jgi:hypothetical protein